MPKIIENIREIILENGKQMLLEESYSDFNLRNLAKKCGLGLGTFYNYFSNKEELAVHIFQNDWDQTLELVDQMKEVDLSFKEKLHRIYQSLEAFLGQYMKVFREIAADEVKGCPYDYYKEIGIRMAELIEAARKADQIHSEVDSEKLSMFILTNLFNTVKMKFMTFDELYDCIRL